jgi:peptidoglycan hydrolase CwlO-like protein
MNDLIIYALILALAYYLLIYLPAQKKLAPASKLATNQSTQTEPTTVDQDLENTLDNLIKNIQQLNQQLK